jgi:HD superfamily phosphohydrolase
MKNFQCESLSHDPIHGYIPFTSRAGLPAGEAAEQQIIDHPWLQRLRQIHQLQTAWWVFPTAEHTRFQHVLGAMHLAGRSVAVLYESLHDVCPDVPSRGYVESLMRLAALLHDVGHGPFGHFFDEHYLSTYHLNHELLGCEIIRREFADLIRRIRRNPSHQLEPHETLDPEQIAFLITRPKSANSEGSRWPRWLCFLQSLFSGLYTVDNMDFVLRDAYMSGYSAKAFDIDRLLHYSLFTEKGLTIHERGLSALVRFISVRAELFRTIYFHRTVRAIDLELQDLFHDSKRFLFPGNPLDHLDEYRHFTEWSLLMQVARWQQSDDPILRDLGERWERLSCRQLHWKMACEQTVFFSPGESERSNVFSSAASFEAAIREALPDDLRNMPLRVDTARHVHRPGAHTPTSGLNFLYDPATSKIHHLDARELFRRISISYRICRIYSQDHEHNAELASAMEQLTQTSGADDATNM